MIFDLPPSLVAVLTGFLSGFLLSIPVGPVNVTIINEGARQGLLWALMIGMGAVAMEVIYCALAFTGFASLFTGPMMQAAMELTSFVFMLYLGVRFLSVRSVEMPSPVEERIKVKLNPHSAFATGFVDEVVPSSMLLAVARQRATYLASGVLQRPALHTRRRPPNTHASNGRCISERRCRRLRPTQQLATFVKAFRDLPLLVAKPSVFRLGTEPIRPS